MAVPFVALASLGKWIFDWGSQWLTNRAELAAANHQAELSRIATQAELEIYKQKADLEWDLKWAEGAQKSWKDEFLLILWSIPMIMLFIPPLAPYAIQGFEYVKTLNPDFAAWYVSGWAIIFAATFGIKKAAEIMLPGNTKAAIAAISAAKEDIPSSKLPEIASNISERLAKAKKLRANLEPGGSYIKK